MVVLLFYKSVVGSAMHESFFAINTPLFCVFLIFCFFLAYSMELHYPHVYTRFLLVSRSSELYFFRSDLLSLFHDFDRFLLSDTTDRFKAISSFDLLFDALTEYYFLINDRSFVNTLYSIEERKLKEREMHKKIVSFMDKIKELIN